MITDPRRGSIDYERGSVDCAGCRDVLLLPPTHYVRPRKRGEVFATQAKERGWRWMSGHDRWGWHCPRCAAAGIDPGGS